MRQFQRSLPFAVVVLCAAFLSGTTLARDPHAAETSHEHSTTEESRCEVEYSKEVGPTEIRFPEAAHITLTASFECPDDPVTRHVVLVIESDARLKDAPMSLLRTIDPSAADTLTAVVEFGDVARTRRSLQDNPDRAASAIRGIGGLEGRRIDLGIEQGRQVLLAGRAATPGPGTLTETIVVFGAGANDNGCDPVLEAADRAKDDGLQLIAACGGGTCTDCLRRASGPDGFFGASEPQDLIDAVSDMAAKVPSSGIRGLLISDRLPASMPLVEGQAHPLPSSISADGTRVEWSITRLPDNRATIRYDIAPFALGLWPAGIETTGAYTDGWGRTGAFSFDQPLLYVADPLDGSPCLPENLNNVLEPSRVLLGSTVKNIFHVGIRCPEARFPLHRVLVLDASSGSTGAAGAALRQAAVSVLHETGLRADGDVLAGVVAYNASATTPCELTSDWRAVNDCIGQIGADGGRSIDTGLTEALRALKRGVGESARPWTRESLVLLTTGDNDGSCEPVLAAAEAAKDEGVDLLIACSSDQCDDACLREAASSPQDFYGVDKLYALIDSVAETRLEHYGPYPHDLVVTDIAPENMRFVPGSASPAPAEIELGGNKLIWRTDLVRAEGVTYTLLIEPLEAGVHLTSHRLDGEFADGRGGRGRIVLPVPQLEVLSAAGARLFLPVAHTQRRSE